VITPTRWLSAITPAPDIPAHGEPPGRADGEAEATSRSSRPAFSCPNGASCPYRCAVSRARSGRTDAHGSPTAAHGTGSLPVSSPQRSTDSPAGARQPSSSTTISAASASASCHSTRAGTHPLTPVGRTSTRPLAPASAGTITCRAVSTRRSPTR
jgi:hypothetical protein